jgi:hypothetical protein
MITILERTMCDMVVTYVVEEEASHPAQEGPVNGCRSSTNECPFSFLVMWNGRIRVMEKGD